MHRRELAELRSKLLDWLLNEDIDYESITCDDCPRVMDCKFAYDPYNTNGDCLAEK